MQYSISEMIVLPLNHYQCPYCKPWTSETRKAPHTVGKFKIKTGDSIWLVLQCVKCGKMHKIRIQGKPLLWSDMTNYEKRLFNSKRVIRDERS